MVSFSSYDGLNLPSLSKQERHFLKTMASTSPLELTLTSFGPQPLLMETFSARASSISSLLAGMVSLDSRQYIPTFLAPKR